MTRDDVAHWLDRYSEAWRTYDPGQIRSLFSSDAELWDHPWEDPIVGADAILQDWLADRDEEGTYESRYEPWAVDGSRAVGVGTSTYRVDGRSRVFPQRVPSRVRRAGRLPLVQGHLSRAILTAVPRAQT